MILYSNPHPIQFHWGFVRGRFFIDYLQSRIPWRSRFKVETEDGIFIQEWDNCQSRLVLPGPPGPTEKML